MIGGVYVEKRVLPNAGSCRHVKLMKMAWSQRVAVSFGMVLAGAGSPALANGTLDFFYGDLLVGKLQSSGVTDFSFSFLAAPIGSNAFINDILLDIGNGVFTNTPSTGVATPTYSYNASGFEGTSFRSKVSFQTANGAGRFTVGETATWNIAGAVFGDNARTHINAFLYNESTGKYESVKLTTPVPEPEAYAMGMVGFGVVWLLTRRRKGIKV